MRNWKRSLLVGLALLAIEAAPGAGAEIADCKRTCRDAINACVQVCNTSPVGRARGACKSACRRARKPCIQICRTDIPG